MLRLALSCAASACLLMGAEAKAYFKETFDGGMAKWKSSAWKEAEGAKGEFEVTAGDFFGDAEINKGIKTTPDARFYNAYAPLDEAFTNEGKDLVLQFSAKNEQGIDCGGGYIKLLPKSSDMSDFSGDTPYSIMFGPDICGSNKRVHAIFTYNGENLLKKVDVPCATDKLTHVYTMHVKPDNTYAIFVDGEEKASGNLEDDWAFLKPKTIPDPDAKKPEDWDERATIPDETDVKPEGWDDEDDGEWEAPMIDNPEYKGEWKQKTIDNPDYKGVWSPPDIDNPEYVPDDKLYLHKDLAHVGFELWQVKAGTVFDNIFVGDSLEEAEAFRKETFDAVKDAEEERKRLEAEDEDEEDEEDEDEDEDEEEKPTKDEL